MMVSSTWTAVDQGGGDLDLQAVTFGVVDRLCDPFCVCVPGVPNVITVR